MIVQALIIGVVIGGLIILYFISPRFHRVSVSFAHLMPLHNNKQSLTWQFNLKNLLLSRSFWIQLFILLLLLLALLIPDVNFATNLSKQHMGIQIVLDTSASMSTLQNGKTRMDVAHRKVTELTEQIRSLKTDFPICIKLSGFDLEEEPAPSLFTVQDIEPAVQNMPYRTLGTDVSFVRRIISGAGDDQTNSSCSITHLLVISDLPAPEWIEEAMVGKEPLQIIWSDIALPVDNIGIEAVERANSVLGTASEIEVRIAADGTIPLQSVLTLNDVHGNTIQQTSISWEGRRTYSTILSLPHSGQYTLALADGGAYSFDDKVTIINDDTQQIRADWQFPDQRLVSLLGWTLDSTNPLIRVMAYPAVLKDTHIPTLLIGQGYPLSGSASGGHTIEYFVESPLLNDINFDVAEQLDIPGIALPSDADLQPVLYDNRGLSWFAVNQQIPAAYIPGLPVFDGDENLQAFSKIAFFNALHWLLRAYTPPPLYNLTSPAHSTIEGNRNALFPDEGKTLPPVSFGDISDIRPVQTSKDQLPFWLVLITCAAAFFLLERRLNMYGDSRWQ